MRIVSNVSCRENQNTHFMLNKFLSENHAVHEIMWKNYCTTGQATDDNIIRRMRMTSWVIKVTDKHSQYEILTALPQQKRLKVNFKCLGIASTKFVNVFSVHTTLT